MKLTVCTMNGYVHEYHKVAEYKYAPGDTILLIKEATGRLIHHPVRNIAQMTVEEDDGAEAV